MVQRDLKIRYKNSFLGFFWSLLNPLITVSVMTLVFKNLLSNAFKFTQEGSVTLEVGRPGKAQLQRYSLTDEEVISFSVIDTGIGIEPSKFRDIFEAFQQEDGSIDRHYGGTGLGLTIARKFAHMLGGEIHVASRKGEGSRFTILLPFTEPADKALTLPGERLSA